MFYNVDELTKLYKTFLGNVSDRIIEEKLKDIFQFSRELKILGIGYPVPWLENLSNSAIDLFLAIPSQFSDYKWSRYQLNQTFVFEDIAIPIPDFYLENSMIC